MAEHRGRADADRAWDLMGGRPGVRGGLNAWFDAHPRRTAVIGVAAVLVVIGTILGYPLLASGALDPHPAPSVTPS